MKNKTMNLQLILDFIKRHKLTVIATANKQSHPEAAVIEFGNTDELELIFDTLATSRKYKNLQHKKEVAFVIGWDESITVQYEGKAQELSGQEREKYKRIYFEKNPRAQKWEHKPEIRYFKVTPTWIRYSDLKADPWIVHEVKF